MPFEWDDSVTYQVMVTYSDTEQRSFTMHHEETLRTVWMWGEEWASGSNPNRTLIEGDWS